MKIRILLLAGLLLIGSLSLMSYQSPAKNHIQMSEKAVVPDSLLRHVVLFKFKEGTPGDKVAEIQKALVGLKDKIPQIASCEWGLNNSPENLNKGFTHCFFITFKTEEDRAIYLPHPDHKAFGELAGPYIADVLVVDYWTP